jgi:tRNA pseudouridine38-40 synthase
MNYKIIIEYDGTDFSGWQLQPDKRTVQGVLESALQPLGEGRRISVHGAGRTDAGVHARGQVANFQFGANLKAERLLAAINGRLPGDVQVLSIIPVDEDFHARFSALGRHYSYRLTGARVILGRQYCWFVRSEFEDSLLTECANQIVGKHDFVGFSKANSEVDSTICHIKRASWENDGKYLIFNICSNRFLHHMVRFLVGTSLEVARGRYTVEQFTDQLRKGLGQIIPYRAPAAGLVLEQIEY